MTLNCKQSEQQISDKKWVWNSLTSLPSEKGINQYRQILLWQQSQVENMFWFFYSVLTGEPDESTNNYSPVSLEDLSDLDYHTVFNKKPR